MISAATFYQLEYLIKPDEAYPDYARKPRELPVANIYRALTVGPVLVPCFTYVCSLLSSSLPAEKGPIIIPTLQINKREVK